MPGVSLTTTGFEDRIKINPGLPNEVCLLVVIEDRHFEFRVVAGFMNCKAKLLVPIPNLSIFATEMFLDILHTPFWSLPTSSICLGLPSFLPKPSSAVRVLLSHCFQVRQIFSSIDNDDERTDLGSVQVPIRKDSSRVLGRSRRFFGDLRSHTRSVWKILVQYSSLLPRLKMTGHNRA